jgi:hypothetical protein
VLADSLPTLLLLHLNPQARRRCLHAPMVAADCASACKTEAASRSSSTPNKRAHCSLQPNQPIILISYLLQPIILISYLLISAPLAASAIYSNGSTAACHPGATPACPPHCHEPRCDTTRVVISRRASGSTASCATCRRCLTTAATRRRLTLRVLSRDTPLAHNCRAWPRIPCRVLML